MKRRQALTVGLVIIFAAVVVVAGALWLGEHQFGERWYLQSARFATIGRMSVGAPVTVRGVRVGQVEAIRLAPDGWVLADLRIDRTVPIPQRPAVIVAPSSLFGEWTAEVISLENNPPDDPRVFVLLQSAEDPLQLVWPGAALPDVGQLTAQAGRIAGDIAVLAERLGSAIDSSTADALRTSVGDFVEIARQLRTFTVSQTTSMSAAGADVVATAEAAALAARDLRVAMARLDSATAQDQLGQIVTSAQGSSEDLRHATADLRSIMASAREHEASLINVLVSADSVMSRLEAGTGTLGLMVRDSALYVETTQAVREMRQLIADIQANPRRYFSFSVF